MVSDGVVAVIAAVVAVGIGGGAYKIVTASSSNASDAAVPVSGQVVPFAPGQPGISQVVGQIPPDYTQGSGMIVTGQAADAATAAAVAAFPGGTVDRVVQLSNGNYEVHMIAVNWPHHIFVNHVSRGDRGGLGLRVRPPPLNGTTETSVRRSHH